MKKKIFELPENSVLLFYPRRFEASTSLKNLNKRASR